MRSQREAAPSPDLAPLPSHPASADGWVIPPAMWPRRAMHEVPGRDGRTYLLRNDAMFTAVQHSQGEFSEFFLALRDECRIFGHRCPSCRHLIVPPFMRRCPTCNFVEMTREYVADRGVLAATPVITIFAPSRFKDQVPFCTGRVFLTTSDGQPADTALLVRARTTRGAIRPGIFGKNTPVKLVFCDQRQGEMLDVFVVPAAELSAAQLARSPLMESDLEWDQVEEVHFPPPTAAVSEEFRALVRAFGDLGQRVDRSMRARHDLAGWDRLVQIRTEGGAFHFEIHDGRLAIREDPARPPDLTLTLKQQHALLLWVQEAISGPVRPQSPPLTDLVLDGLILLSKNELETVTRLDRLPRSLRREDPRAA